MLGEKNLQCALTALHKGALRRVTALKDTRFMLSSLPRDSAS